MPTPSLPHSRLHSCATDISRINLPQGTDGDKWHISIPYTMVRLAECRAGQHLGSLGYVLTVHLGELHGTLKTICEDISQSGCAVLLLSCEALHS